MNEKKASEAKETAEKVSKVEKQTEDILTEFEDLAKENKKR